GPGPRPEVRARQRGDLEHALRTDDDLGECEAIVREGREQLRVEGAGAGVTLPALAGRHELVDAIRGEGRDQAVDVAGILRDRMADPQFLDRAQLVRVEPAGAGGAGTWGGGGAH